MAWESESKQKCLTPASWDNGIKTDVVDYHHSNIETLMQNIKRML